MTSRLLSNMFICYRQDTKSILMLVGEKKMASTVLEYNDCYYVTSKCATEAKYHPNPNFDIIFLIPQKILKFKGKKFFF